MGEVIGAIVGAVIAAAGSAASAMSAADAQEEALKQAKEEKERLQKNMSWVKQNMRPELTNASVSGLGPLSGTSDEIAKAANPDLQGMQNKIDAIKTDGSVAVMPMQPTLDGAGSTGNASPYGAGSGLLNSARAMPDAAKQAGIGSTASAGGDFANDALTQIQAKTGNGVSMPSSLEAAVQSGSVPAASVNPQPLSSPLFDQQTGKMIAGAALGIGKGIAQQSAASVAATREQIRQVQQQMAEQELERRRFAANFSRGVQPMRVHGASID